MFGKKLMANTSLEIDLPSCRGSITELITIVRADLEVLLGCGSWDQWLVNVSNGLFHLFIHGVY